MSKTNEVDMKSLALALGYDSLSAFAKDWRTLSSDEKDSIKASFRLYIAKA